MLGGEIVLFEAGAFYPDFILWLLRGDKQHVIFVEPHGLRMESADSPKLKFFATIKGIEARVNIGRGENEKIELECFITTPTLMNQIDCLPGAATIDDFAARHVLLMRNDSSYINRMLEAVLN